MTKPDNTKTEQLSYGKLAEKTIASVIPLYHSRVLLNESTNVVGTAGIHTGFKGFLAQTSSGVMQTVHNGNKYIVESKPAFPYSYFSISFGLNTLRGSSAIFSSAAGRQLAQNHIDENNRFLRPLANVNGALFGTCAALAFETPFIRMQRGLAPFRYNFNLSSVVVALFGREISFASTVFGQDKYPLALNALLIIPGAYLTGACHRYFAFGVSQESRAPGSYPDWSQGYAKTISDISRGKINDPTFKNLPYPEPTSRMQLTANFLAVSCTMNTFIFRVNYLAQLSIMLWGYNQVVALLKKKEDPANTLPNSTASISDSYKVLIQRGLFNRGRSVDAVKHEPALAEPQASPTIKS